MTAVPLALGTFQRPTRPLWQGAPAGRRGLWSRVRTALGVLATAGTLGGARSSLSPGAAWSGTAHTRGELPAQHTRTSGACASSGLLRAGVSGEVAVVAPMQSAGMLSPLVPLLGTAGGREGQRGSGRAAPPPRSLPPLRPMVSLVLCKEQDLAPPLKITNPYRKTSNPELKLHRTENILRLIPQRTHMNFSVLRSNTTVKRKKEEVSKEQLRVL